MMRRALCLWSSLAACSPANEEEEVLPTPPIVWEGEWLRYGRSPSLAPQCAGVAPYMNDLIGALTAEFQIHREVTVDYYYVDAEDNPCGALGCAKDTAVYSRATLLEHEVVHGVRAHVDFSHLLLEEGAAEYWGDDSREFPFRTMTAGDVVETAGRTSHDGLESEAYGIAGRFYAFLEERTEPSVLLQLLASTVPEQFGPDTLSTELLRITGRDLDAWNAEFQAEYPVCDQFEFRDPTPVCDSVRQVERCDGGDFVPFTTRVACDDEETLGPRDGEIWKYLAVELPEDGRYGVFVSTQPEIDGASIRIEECRGGCGSTTTSFDVPTGITPATALDAPAGRYLLRLAVPEGTEAEFEVLISGGSCPL